MTDMHCLDVCQLPLNCGLVTNYTTLGAVHLDRNGLEIGRSGAKHPTSALSLRRVAFDALRIDALAVVLLHHTSGEPGKPTNADFQALRTARQTLKAIGIMVHDHVVCDASDCVSLRLTGQL